MWYDYFYGLAKYITAFKIASFDFGHKYSKRTEFPIEVSTLGLDCIMTLEFGPTWDKTFFALFYAITFLTILPKTPRTIEFIQTICWIYIHLDTSLAYSFLLNHVLISNSRFSSIFCFVHCYIHIIDKILRAAIFDFAFITVSRLLFISFLYQVKPSGFFNVKI